MKVGYKLHIFYSPLPRSSFWLLDDSDGIEAYADYTTVMPGLETRINVPSSLSCQSRRLIYAEHKLKFYGIKGPKHPDLASNLCLVSEALRVFCGKPFIARCLEVRPRAVAHSCPRASSSKKTTRTRDLRLLVVSSEVT